MLGILTFGPLGVDLDTFKWGTGSDQIIIIIGRHHHFFYRTVDSSGFLGITRGVNGIKFINGYLNAYQIRGFVWISYHNDSRVYPRFSGINLGLKSKRGALGKFRRIFNAIFSIQNLTSLYCHVLSLRCVLIGFFV